MSLRRLAVVSLLLLVVGGSACKKKKSDTPVASCDNPNADKNLGSARECTDAFDKSNMYSCSEKGAKQSDKPCPREGAVAGCKWDDSLRWFYNGDTGFATVESIGRWCLDIRKGTTILPDGKPASVKTADQLGADELKTNLDKYGPKAKAAVATAATIGAKLPAPTGKLDLQGLKGKALLVHREDLGDLENPKKLAYRLKDAGQLAACSRLLNGRKKSSDAPYELQYCATNPLLAVLSVSTYAPATATGSTVSGNTKTTFVKRAAMSGDVLFFRLDNGKYLGSFPFSFESSNTTSSPERQTTDLHESFARGLYFKAQSAAPGASLTFDLEK
jgi:hypothetical protein